MSGEAGGVLIGGIVLLGALPVVLAGAAVVGAAAGAVAIGRAAVRAGAEAHRRKQLAVEGCSAELSALYRQMQGALDAQSRFQAEFYERVQQQMDQLSGEMRQAAQAGGDKLDGLLRQAKDQQLQAMGAARTEELERVRRETEAETGAAMQVFQEAQRAKMEVLDWKASTAAARAGQEAMARDLLRDAEATLRLLESLGTDDAAFRQRVESMRGAYQTAAQALERGGFQAAAAGAQQVVSRGASLALEQELRQRERDQVRVALTARLEGLLAELDAQKAITFQDDLYGQVEEHMDDFTQGAFSQIRQQAQAQLDGLRSPEGRSWSAGKLQLLLDEAEAELLPQAGSVLRTGYDKMLQYYQRLHALETVSGYMEEQGYAVDWIQPAGGDVTQKLVVNFREPQSGNTIAVSLDEDAGSEDIGRMAMEVLFYYANGRPVTEEEKETLRQGVLDALREKGLTGALHCTGCVDQEAADKTLGSAQAVEKLPPRPIAFQG